MATLSTRFRIVLALVIVAISVGVIGSLGWANIVPTIFLAFIFLLVVYAKYRVAAIAMSALVLAGFVIPIINPAAPAARKMACSANLHRIAQAMRAYEVANGTLPPPALLSEDGHPLLSWRVLILPYLGESELYLSLDLSKPWDHPRNLEIGKRMPGIYRCPELQIQSKWHSVGEFTTYVGVVGPGTLWGDGEARRSADFLPNKGNVLILESVQHSIHWMSPNDPTLDEFISSVKLGPHGDMLMSVDLEGNSRGLSTQMGAGLLEKLLYAPDRVGLTGRGTDAEE